MSNCVVINSLEHLPAEQTLLIHYTVTCTGNWYLAQMLTAYRNVCDTEWTVMFPNHQHPRHTDFPLNLTVPGYQATFAWNYGGIQGISAENFDEQHSYLTQIGLFNYDCLYTGSPPNTGEATGEVLIGSPGFTGILIGNNPGGGGPNGGGGGGGGGGNPGFPNIPSAGFPMQFQDPSVGLPGGGGGEPSGEPPVSIVVAGIGTSLPGNTQVENNNSTISINHSETTRPSQVSAGAISNPNLVFNSLTRSTSIPGQPGLVGTQIFGNVDPNTVEISAQGNSPGTLYSTLISQGLSLAPTLSNQVNIPSVLYNSFINIQIGSTEVHIGEPILISTVFQPPAGVELQARMELTAQSALGVIPVLSTGLTTVTNSTPLSLGSSIASSQFPIGTIILTVKVYDNQSAVIGISSVVVLNLETNNSGLSQNSHVTIGNELPSPIVNSNTFKLSESPIPIDLPEDKSAHLVIEAATSQTKMSAVLVTKFNTQDSYSMTLYDKGLTDSDAVSDQTITAGALQNTVRFYTNEKFKINNQVVYPHTHTVGFSDAPFAATKFMILEIAPSVNNVSGDTSGLLYLSSNFNLRTITTTLSTTSVIARLPYIGMNVGLVIHGPVQGLISETYTVLSAKSDSTGVATWTGLSLRPGDYFSIFKTTNGVLNPFSEPIYQGRYQP